MHLDSVNTEVTQKTLHFSPVHISSIILDVLKFKHMEHLQSKVVLLENSKRNVNNKANFLTNWLRSEAFNQCNLHNVLEESVI